MVKHCITSKYSPTICYDITERDNKILKIITIIILIVIVILCINRVLGHLTHHRTQFKVDPFTGTGLVILLCLVLAYWFYSSYAIAGKRVLCRGRRDYHCK